VSTLLFNYKNDLTPNCNLWDALGISQEDVFRLREETARIFNKLFSSREQKRSTEIALLSAEFSGKTCDEIAFIVHSLIEILSHEGMQLMGRVEMLEIEKAERETKEGGNNASKQKRILQSVH
jgi:hypothetical protein